MALSLSREHLQLVRGKLVSERDALSDAIRQLDVELGDPVGALTKTGEPRKKPGRKPGTQTQGKGMTPEGRQRIADAQRARWAAKKNGTATPTQESQLGVQPLPAAEPPPSPVQQPILSSAEGEPVRPAEAARYPNRGRKGAKKGASHN